MRFLWTTLGSLGGLAFGVVVGFGVALVAMSLGKSKYDGSYGMIEMLVCLPSGAALGLLAGAVLGYKHAA